MAGNSRSKGSSKSRSTQSRTNRSTSKKAAERQEMARRQIWAVVLFALGILLLFLAVIQGQNFWQVLHNLMFGLFGWCGYLMGPLSIYIAIMIATDKTVTSVKATLIESGALLLLLCGITQVLSGGMPAAASFWKNATILYDQGVSLSGGGLLSAPIGLTLLGLFGKTPATITIILLIFVFVMLLTGTTLLQFFHKAYQPVKKVGEVYTQKVAQRQPPKFNIDIPVDDPIEPSAQQLPQHPVSSPKGSMTGAQHLMQLNDQLLDAPSEAAQDAPPVSTDNVTVFPGTAQAGSGSKKSKQKQRSEAMDEIDDLISKMLNGGKDKYSSPVEIIQEDPELFPSESPGEILRKLAEEPPVTAETIEEAKKASLSGQPSAGNPESSGKKSRQEEKGEAVPSEEIAAEIATTQQELPETEEYVFPSPGLLNEPKPQPEDDISEELKANAARLVDTLSSFGVQTRIVDISRGPAVTRYELQPSAGVKISRITSLTDDIALNLAAAGVRIEAPIPGKAAVGIEVPNKVVSTVPIREVIDSREFADASSRLTVALGRDIGGAIAIADLSKMPHLLIAGSTGSGKSVCINSFIISLLFKSSPDEVKLLMVDPKVVELGVYNGIPHLLVPVVTDPRKAAGALNWAVSEMLHRYQTFADNSVRDLKGYNKLASTREELKPMPQIVIIIDELADLMMAAPNDVEDAICRLAQMARAAGMHLVIATQRPSVDVITGVIKANIPSRIAFAVSSQVDSRTILDSGGAEKLLGKGDMLFSPVGSNKPTRIQGCFVSDDEVEKVVDFIKNGGSAAYDNTIMEEIEKQAVAEKSKGNSGDGGGFDAEDEMLPAAIEVVVEAGIASTSLLQRRLKLGYARAARIVDEMEQRGIVGPFEGSKPRQVLISKERWMEMKLNQSK